MFCVNCGKVLPDSGGSFCPNCGEPVETRPDKSMETADMPASKSSNDIAGTRKIIDQKLRVAPSIVFVVILVIAAIVVFSLGNRDAILDVKSIVFDSYGKSAIGTVVDHSLSDVRWQKERLDKDNFIVTVTGFNEELASDLSIVFRAKYRDDSVYVTVERVGIDDEMADDLFSIAIVMAAVYGN